MIDPNERQGGWRRFLRMFRREPEMRSPSGGVLFRLRSWFLRPSFFIFIALLIAWQVALPWPWQEQDETQVLLDEDFEDPGPWTVNRANGAMPDLAIMDQGPTSNGNCLKISSRDYSDADAFLAVDVPRDFPRRLQISARLKTLGLKAKSSTQLHGALFLLEYAQPAEVKSKNRMLAQTNLGENLEGDAPWTLVSEEVTLQPKTRSLKLGVSLGNWGQAKGATLADDILIVAFREPGRLETLSMPGKRTLATVVIVAMAAGWATRRRLSDRLHHLLTQTVGETLEASRDLLIEIVTPAVLLTIFLDAFGRVVWPGFIGKDIEVYATIAYFWPEGLIPYRDLYDFKPPLIYVALRSGFALWGADVQALWRVFVIVITGSSLAVYAGLRRGGMPMAAIPTALGLMTLFLADPARIFGAQQNTEFLTVAFVSVALGCAAAHQRGGHWKWAMATGAALAAAVLGKQPAAFYGLPLGLMLCFQPRKKGLRALIHHVFGRALAAAAGFFIVLLVFVLYFAWHGALHDFYDSIVAEGIRYSHLEKQQVLKVLTRPTSKIVVEILGYETMWPFTGAILLMVPLTILRPSRWIVVTWLWLAAGYLAVVIGPRSEAHYFILGFPALALTLGMVLQIGLSEWKAVQRTTAARRLLLALAITFLLFGGFWIASWLPKRAVRCPLSPRNQQIQAVGEAVRGKSKPGDKLLAASEPYLLYVYSGVPPLNRTFNEHNLNKLIFGKPPKKRSYNQYRNVVLQDCPFIFLSHALDQRLPRHHAEFARLLKEHYVKWIDKPIGLMYLRKDRVNKDSK